MPVEMTDEAVRKDEIRSAIAQATIVAIDAGMPMTIYACMAPCVPPPTGENCPLCEIIVVDQHGIVSRETRGH